MKPPVLMTCRIPAAPTRALEAVCDVERLEERPVTEERLIARLPGKRALICLLTERIDRAVLEAGRDLKIVANIAVGYDNVDVAAARERGVVVTNTPDVLTGATAEFTWGLILAAARRIPEGERLLRRGAWEGWALDFMLGTELTGKQLGLVGLGRIGRAVAARAPAFGMRVAYADRPGTPPPESVPDARALSLDELLVTSDVVSIHTPLTPETRHLIDRRALARMRRTAILVNTARGPVVDEAALAWALEERLISAAALDVYAQEPAVHPRLLRLDNVVLAPHMGSGTIETRTAMADLAVRNVVAVLTGKPAITPI